MPEHRQKQFSREYYSRRTAYQKALDKAVREQAKGTGWQTVRGELFRQQADWFIGARPNVWRNQDKTTLKVSVKPMALDPVFWDLIGLPENRRLPVSFRQVGAWTCSGPYFAEPQLEEHTNPPVLAARAIETADEYLKILQTYTIEDFLAFCRAAAARHENYLTPVVATLVVMHREQEALAICEGAIAKGLVGGFSAPAGTFFEMAAAWLHRSISGTSATRH